MKLYEQRDLLVGAIELAFPYLGAGPTSSHYGHARDDCALVHMDYFAGIQDATSVLANALADISGETAADTHRRLGEKWTCDCPACVGEEAAAKAREKAREAYTNVKEWV